MTKTYIKPETKTYEVELHLMDSNSPFEKNEDPDKVVTDEEEVLSRGFSFFEENEEDF